MHSAPRQVERGDVEASDLGRLGGHRREQRPGVGALEGQERPFLGEIVDRPRPERLDDPFGVRGVGHDVEALVVDPPDDDVVEHRCVVLIEQVGVLGPPGPILPRSLVNARCRRSSASGPAKRTVPRWLTSNTTAPVRQARCSASVPEGYCRGMSQPPNGTILAPRARWVASSEDRWLLTAGDATGGPVSPLQPAGDRVGRLRRRLRLAAARAPQRRARSGPRRAPGGSAPPVP